MCMCTDIYVHGYAGELFAAMRLTCRWVSEGKPEDMRGGIPFFLPHLIYMYVCITCRVGELGYVPKGSPEVWSREVLSL